jgi:hypothetical protein
MECYCSICRKTAGGGGFAINLGADANTMKITGKEFISIYHARMEDEDGEVEESKAERHFCSKCGTALWLWTQEWPDLIHPLAAAIDTPLPKAPERMRLMLNYKPDWVQVPKDKSPAFDEYPDISLEDWHKQQGLYDATPKSRPKKNKKPKTNE